MRALNLLLRIATEWLIWLPLWFVSAAGLHSEGRFGLAAAMLASIFAGLALTVLPAWIRRSVLIVAGLALLIVGFGYYPNRLPLLAGLGIILWRGRYRKFGYWQYGLGFGICCVALAAISISETWTNYRLPLILLGAGWLVAWFAALNRRLIDSAGLDNGIVTGPVKRAGRRYLLAFLAVGAVIVALTAGYGEKLLTPKHTVNPGYDWIDPERFMQPPQEENNPWAGMFPDEKSEPSPLWDYLFWVMLALSAVGIAWFVRLVWRDRTWTWRNLLKGIRNWFVREKPEEKLPYVEERRSLKKAKPDEGLFDRLFRRKESRADWERLDAPGKARRLYEDAVLAGIGQGYGFKPSDTPAETLDGIERWRAGAASSEGKPGAYWRKLLGVRGALLHLYEKARYSPHAIEEKEVEELRQRVKE